jgi:hypothetical protein
MQIKWHTIYRPNLKLSDSQIHDACRSFYLTHKIPPNIIKMPYKVLSSFLQFREQSPSVGILDKTKEYGLFTTTPYGVVELIVSEEINIEDDGETYITIESSYIDREFEKYVLGNGAT